ncbi:etoposide-induced protein 2.4-domain-containing protein [Phlyctochytrium arcticum]|nr:etoposide-induced protein 2.4-domain-containing protein [Phlyctochytrium arcticum]
MERPLRSALKKNASPPSPASPKTSHAPGTPINSTAGASRKEDKVVENKGEKPSSSLKRREIRVVSIKDAVLLHAGFVYAGIKDASAWPTSLLTIYGSKTIQLYTFKCVLLNGFIFLGSLLLFHSLILPLSRYIYSSATQQSHPPYLDSLFTIAYYVLWLYPMYAISFLANAMWYQKIADRSYSIQVGKPVATKLNYDKLLAMISGEAYRTLLLLNFLILPLLIKFIPYVGPFLCFISFCWLASFYSFEYKWMSQGWTLQQRVDHFEERWAYYIGFVHHHVKSSETSAAVE